MFTLVIGGAASGKSEYAEAHVETLPGRRLYIATMEPWDEECRARIARHQAARAHKRFTTVECYRNLSQLTVPPDSNVLLECLEIWWPMSDMGDRAAAWPRLWQG